MKEILDIQFHYKALHNFIDIDMSSMVQHQNTGYVVTRSTLNPINFFLPTSALKQLPTFTLIELFIFGMTSRCSCNA